MWWTDWRPFGRMPRPVAPLAFHPSARTRVIGHQEPPRTRRADPPDPWNAERSRAWRSLRARIGGAGPRRPARGLVATSRRNGDGAMIRLRHDFDFLVSIGLLATGLATGLTGL